MNESVKKVFFKRKITYLVIISESLFGVVFFLFINLDIVDGLTPQTLANSLIDLSSPLALLVKSAKVSIS